MKPFNTSQPLTNFDKLEKLRARDTEYKKYQDKLCQK